jgi:hypothetical protein
MNQHELENKELDEIGRKLLEAGMTRDDDLEEIISAPHLFTAIKARVKAQQKPAPENIFDVGRLFSFFRQTNTGAAFAALLIAALAMGGFYLYARQRVSTGIARNTRPLVTDNKDVEVLPIQTAGSTSEHNGDSLKPITAYYRQPYKTNQVVKAIVKKTARPQQNIEPQSDGEFYPLSFTGNSNDIPAGAQIVRVELPRSSLFSMGVDLPDENRSGTVKADLVISSDGVARGFRLVR